MRLFKTLLFVVPFIILAVIVLIFMPRDDKIIIDIGGDEIVARDPGLVDNSKYNFFYRNEQLRIFESKQTPENSMIIKIHNKTAQEIVKDAVALPSPPSKLAYSGGRSLILTTASANVTDIFSDTVTDIVAAGEILEYDRVEFDHYRLTDGGYISTNAAKTLILTQKFFGVSDRVPHRLELNNSYYAAFTDKDETIYFELTSDNQFVSVRLSELSGAVGYVLYDSSFKQIKNGSNSGKEEIEITYRGTKSDKYYLGLTGSYSQQLNPFCISFPRDDNEWLSQMVYINSTDKITGSFDYYGDEDFFVLPLDIIDNINLSAIRIRTAACDVSMTVYDKNKNILGRYLFAKGSKDEAYMYGLHNAFAISIVATDGQAQGINYEFEIGFYDGTMMGIDTYGFALSPKYSEEENYYTATVNSIDDKRIVELKLLISNPTVEITLKQSSGAVYTGLEMDSVLPIGYGANTLDITIKANGFLRVITIVITHTGSYDMSYTFANKQTTLYKSPGSSAVTTISQARKLLSLNETALSGGKSYTKVAYSKTTDSPAYTNEAWILSADLFAYKKIDMPTSYADKINALKASYPNWKFTFVDAGYSFNTYLNLQKDRSIIMASDGTRTPTEEELAYYLDPRNFLSEKSIFMFENQIYKDGNYTKQGVMSVWNSSTFADYFMEAGAISGLSPYFIVGRAALESGRGTSPLSMGTVSGYEGFYNFYGIGARDGNAAAGGGEYAKNAQWDTKRRAIIEGARWIKNGYIDSMQNTAYFIKFSLIPGYVWHQYMTDIAAPSKDALNFYNAHKGGGSLNGSIEFIIPVYSNMP